MLSTFNMWRQGKVFSLRRKEVKGRLDWMEEGREAASGVDAVRNVTCVCLLPPPQAPSAWPARIGCWRRGRAGTLTGLEVGQHAGLSQSLAAVTPMRQKKNSSLIMTKGGTSCRHQRGCCGRVRNVLTFKKKDGKYLVSLTLIGLKANLFSFSCRPTVPLIMTNWVCTYVHIIRTYLPMFVNCSSYNAQMEVMPLYVSLGLHL